MTCDEIGLLVYEENFAAGAHDSAQMAARFYHPPRRWFAATEPPEHRDLARQRDRGRIGVFRAVSDLQLVRDLDETRMVLLNKGASTATPQRR